MAMLWHSHRLVDCCRLCLCRGRWESPICLWKDLILSFHYGNLKKSFSFPRHLGSLFRTLSVTLFLICLVWQYVCIPVCMLARLCVFRHEYKTGSTACVPCVCSFRLVAEHFPHANFQPPWFCMSFLKPPPDGNQLLSSLTGKQLQQTLHYSPLAPALPLPSPHFFSFTHSLSVLLPPKAETVDKQF